jgi:hypothetical protein
VYQPAAAPQGAVAECSCAPPAVRLRRCTILGRFLVNTYQWDWTTIAALVAPRPLLFANSDADTIFPMDGNRRVIAKLRKLYKMYDKPDLVDDYISKGGHEDRADLRVAAFQWMNKHLKNDTTPVKYASYKQLAGKELRVFAEEKDIPKDAINGKIDETFVKRAEVKLPEKRQFAAWKAGMLKELREKSFRGLPSTVPAATVVKDRIVTNILIGPPHATEPDITVLITFTRGAGEGAEHTLLVHNADDKGNMVDLPDWVKGDVADGPLTPLLARGVAAAWTRMSPPNYVERAHALLGRTVDDGRVWDTIATARYFANRLGEGKTHMKVAGRGQAGVIAAYAALFESSIKEVILVDPPTSHKDGPTFLNVLRVLDIPEALGLLAPDVKLTIINGKDKAFDRTAQLYKLAGAEEKFVRK